MSPVSEDYNIYHSWLMKCVPAHRYNGISVYRYVHQFTKGISDEKNKGMLSGKIYNEQNFILFSLFNQLDTQNLFHSKFYFMSLHVSSTCARNM